MLKNSKSHFVFQLLIFMSVFIVAADLKASENPKRWTDNFNVEICAWSSSGRNDYFILEPGYQMTLEGNEGEDTLRLEITVLNETKIVRGIETRIVEEREMVNRELVEISLNYFAVCGPSNDIFYFGETVDLYRNGRITDHEDSWSAEDAGARPGLFMPSRPLIGARFYQEFAPTKAMDRVEIISDSEFLKTPAGEFQNCLKTEETTPLEPDVKEYKLYSKGIGIIQDGDLLLTRYGSGVSKK
jgi:hypothetical protein